MKVRLSFLHTLQRRTLIRLSLLFFFIFFIFTSDYDHSTTSYTRSCPPLSTLLAFDPLSLIRQHSISYRYNNTIIELRIKVPPQSCSVGSDLLIVVFSKCSDFAIRSTLRESWIKEARKNNYTVYFLLGTEKGAEELAYKEAAEHEDVILTDIQELYENLPLKTFVALLWKDTFCPQATWLLKLDVDTDVNVPYLTRLLYLKKGTNNTMFGHLINNPYIERNHTRRWYISMEAFPDARGPNYLSGGAYLMSSDVPRKLIAAHMLCTFAYITVEDMYFTGILAEAAKVNRIHLNEAYLYRSETPYFYDFPHFCASRCRIFSYRDINAPNVRSMRRSLFSLSGVYKVLADVIC